jgi:hypothetical protein
MTPGQNQEIEDAFPPEVYGAAVPQSDMESEESETEETEESSDESGYEDNETNGVTFRNLRKKIQEQTPEEESEEEQLLNMAQQSEEMPEEDVENQEELEDEEEGENDGVEDGVDFTPTLKSRKIQNQVRTSSYTGATNNGFPVLGISEGIGKELAKRILQVKGNVTKVNFRPVKSPEELVTAYTRSRQIRPLRTEPPIDFKKQSELLMGRRPFPTIPMDKLKKWEPESFDEAVEYHIQNNLSLVENVYRPGSEMFFAMILEAKRLYAEGLYTPKDEYEQDLLESDIGEVAEYNGEQVLLDYPYEEDMEECWKGYTQKGMKKKGDKMVPNCVPMEEENDPTKGKGIGKPFRSRGGGAVYVRNEKGNVIKVNFSQSGMKKRFNEPARVKSFVARHNCYGNKDKTSASYWACRWPRYFSDSGQRWW